jgi:integrase
MPRKPVVEKQQVSIVIDGTPVAVTLHPPQGTRRSWYAYWNGLVASKSTGRHEFDAAVAAAEAMLKAWKQGGEGHRPLPTDGVMTDDEFEAIQRKYYGRKTDPAAAMRSRSSLTSCMEAIRAFKTISGLDRIVLATPADCERFQTMALTKPKNWQRSYPRMKPAEEVERLSPNTVVKWSTALQAAFQRANRNGGKKCVRSVVEEGRLLVSNPWSQFTWIEGREKPIRHLDAGEIASFLDFLETDWAEVAVGPLMAKVFIWSACRLQEVMGLEWSFLRRAGEEIHFHVIGKWGIPRWIRIPPAVLGQLEAHRTRSPFVFAAYCDQDRRHHELKGRPDLAAKVLRVYDPANPANWFGNRMDDWSSTLASGHAHTHLLRKTTLQFARIGEDANRAVAADARVGEAVMMASYVREGDEQLRQSSNRTYARIVAALPPDLARRMGYEAAAVPADPEAAIREAMAARDWGRVAELSALLKERRTAG